MSLLGQLRETNPELADSVQLLDQRLRRRYDLSLGVRRPEEPGRPVAEALEATFSGAQLSRVAEAVLSLSTPPAGIYGGGVVRHQDDLRLAVFLMVELLRAADVVDSDIVGLPESRVISRYLQELGMFLTDDTMIVGLEYPSEQVAPGDALFCLGMRGTCGVAVATSTGEAGILTAGHVARGLNVSVDDATGRIGTVLWFDSLAEHAPREACADVAVIKLRAGVGVTGGPAIATSGTADQRSRVVSHGQEGPRSAWLRAPLMPSFALTQDRGDWGDVFLTSQAISIGGDSGAPVLLDDETKTVVGLIVAGAGSYSLVQDISYVFTETRTSLVPSS
jgi:hypothetical protein